MTELQGILLSHAQMHKEFHTQDAICIIYENEYGIDCTASSQGNAVFFKNELQNSKFLSDLVCEDIGNGKIRVYVESVNETVKKSIVGFSYIPSLNVCGNDASFRNKCRELVDLVRKDSSFLYGESVEEILENYLKEGIHLPLHSSAYCNHNCTHYNVMNRENFVLMAIYLNARQLICQKGKCVIAIDGRCGSGKSTFAEILQKKLDADIVHMDDFFLQSYQRTPQRAEMIGGNFDYERFKEEIIQPLQTGSLNCYHRFDCSIMKINELIRLQNKSVLIVEGSYSLHPILGSYYDISVSVDIDEKTQSARILKRNGKEKHKQFINLWIPKENVYFNTYNIIEKAQYHL